VGAAPGAAPGEALTTLATYRARREVAMFYRVDLRRDNAHSPAVAGVIRANDARLRTCYTDRLAEAPDLKGQMVFSFRLSRRSGTMSRIARVGGSLDDKRLEQCLRQRLAKLAFHPPRDMGGTLAYDFDARETALGPARAALP
jgi:hypothetical protein